MQKPLYLLICFGCFLSVNFFSHRAKAQQNNAEVAKQLVEMADEVYANNSKRPANEQYVQAAQRDPNNLRANYMAGITYLETIHRYRALSYLKKAYELDPNVSSDILFLIGKAQQLSNKFEEAINSYEGYKTQLEGRMNDRDLTRHKYNKLVADVDYKIEQCRVAKKLEANPEPVRRRSLTRINSKWPDYAPALTEDGKTMIFTSRRAGMSRDVYKDLIYFEDIYISTRSSTDDKWSAPKLVEPGKVNTEKHESNMGVSAKGDRFMLYKDDNAGDIFVTERKGDSWSKPKSISKMINTEFKESSASLSEDGKFLYFSSNKPGGVGGFDLYVSEQLREGVWGSPHNMGEVINTEYDEESPFISFDNNTLYFSSKGHEGMGGYDIFKSEYDSVKQQWGEPENVGYPINSPDDDLYYIHAPDTNLAYYATIIEGGRGDLDIVVVEPKGDTASGEPLAMKPDSLQAEPDTLAQEPIASADTLEPDTLPDNGPEEFDDLEEEDERLALNEPQKDTLPEKEAKVEPIESEPEPEPEIEPAPKPFQAVTFNLSVVNPEGENLSDVRVSMKNTETGKTIDLKKVEPGQFMINFTHEKDKNYQVSLKKTATSSKTST